MVGLQTKLEKHFYVTETRKNKTFNAGLLYDTSMPR